MGKPLATKGKPSASVRITGSIPGGNFLTFFIILFPVTRSGFNETVEPAT